MLKQSKLNRPVKALGYNANWALTEMIMIMTMMVTMTMATIGMMIMTIMNNSDSSFDDRQECRPVTGQMSMFTALSWSINIQHSDTIFRKASLRTLHSFV